jgi:hypothetical protein
MGAVEPKKTGSEGVRAKVKAVMVTMRTLTFWTLTMT